MKKRPQTSIVCSILFVFACTGARDLAPPPRVTSDSATQLIAAAKAAYDAGRYAEAVRDFEAAADAVLNAESAARFVSTGEYPSLDLYEVSQMYLALANQRLNRRAEAGRAITQVLSAEKVNRVYAALDIDPQVRSEFESLVAEIYPTAQLPAAAPVMVATAPETAPGAVAASASDVAAPAPEPAVEQRSATLRNAREIEAEREAHKRAINEQIAAVRSECMREAERRIAEERAAAEEAAAAKIAAAQQERHHLIATAKRDAEARIAAEQREAEARIAAAQREAEARVAAAQREAEARVAAAQREAETRLAETRRDAEQRLVAERIAADRAVAERLAAERAAAERAEAERRTAEERAEAERIAVARAAAEREAADRFREESAAIRQASALFAAGDIRATELYEELLARPQLSRASLVEVATGLYRSGDFQKAAEAFARLGPFQPGEEDLHYYRAVSLFEIGKYREAERELAAALPHIELTAAVDRYRAKIEAAAAAFR